MLFRIAIENNVEGRSQAWILGHPGCFSYGHGEEEALAGASQAVLDYASWIRVHGGSWFDPRPIEVYQEEVWNVYAIDQHYNLTQEGYEVNAWFRHDWKPLSAQDVQRGVKLLSWSREELLAAVGGLDAEILDHQLPGQRWSILGILGHVGGAEWWYLDRLGLAFPREALPQDSYDRLTLVRSRTLEVLPNLVGSNLVVGVDGEFWSPRKLLRRAVWHERDHTAHIIELITSMDAKDPKS